MESWPLWLQRDRSPEPSCSSKGKRAERLASVALCVHHDLRGMSRYRLRRCLSHARWSFVKLQMQHAKHFELWLNLKAEWQVIMLPPSRSRCPTRFAQVHTTAPTRRWLVAPWPWLQFQWPWGKTNSLIRKLVMQTCPLPFLHS